MLKIKGIQSKQEIQWDFQNIHKVRDLACFECGMSLALRNAMRSSYDLDVYEINHMKRMLSAQNLKPVEPKLEIKPQNLYEILNIGYYFPNLMLHSDYSGNYTLDGEVSPSMETGNIKGLSNELSILMESFNNDEFKNYMDRIPYLIELGNLVKEEVDFVNAEIIFEKFEPEKVE